jgi:hypothetical protein
MFEFLNNLDIFNWLIDMPNWVTFVADVILAILLFIIGYIIDRRSSQRDKKARGRQDNIENEFRRQHQQQLEHTTEIVESIKATLDNEKKKVFEESLSEFLYKRIRDDLNKFKTLWEGYLSDNMMRIHRRLENEIAILGADMIDLSSRALGILSEEDAQKIKTLAFEYDKFGNRIGSLGDKQQFNDIGNKLIEKTNELLEIINSRIGNG